MRGWAAPLAGLLLSAAAALALALWLLPRERAEFSLRRVDFSALSEWSGDDHRAALDAFLAGCGALPQSTARTALAPRGLRLDGRLLSTACADVETMIAAGETPRDIFESLFRVYRVSGPKGSEGLFTGYYEPVFAARHEADGEFAHPLLARPGDLIDVNLGRFRPELAGVTVSGRVSGAQLVPFAERSEIDGGALAGRGLEIAWLADPFDAFLVHVQGSARLVFPDGGSRRIGFAGQNGHAYTSIGRLLVERGELSLEEASVPAIRSWITGHPEAGRALLAENARYVFFRSLEGTAAPVGALGVELTAKRSMAVDRGYIPLGLPVWVETEIPVAGDPGDKTEPFRRLMVAEDTGAAIVGPLRGDIYLGSGEAAGDVAGRLRAEGRLYLLVPKGAVLRGE